MARASTTSASGSSAVLRDESFWSAFLIGVGIMAAVDEIVFHQLLAWHHFYDRATSDLALVSDGLLHAAELIALVAGFFLLAAARHREFSPIAATRFSRSRFSVARRPAPRLPPPSSAR